MIAETAYHVYKAISSPHELQRFYDMIDRDRKGCQKPPTKKKSDDEAEFDFWRQQIWGILVRQRERNIAKEKTTAKSPQLPGSRQLK